MRILYLWDADYPWDIRVEKVTRALMDDGHDLHLLARNRRRRPRVERQGDGLVIHRIRALPPAFGALNGPFTFPAFFNPVWLAALAETVRRERIEMIMVRDLPLAPTALWVARRAGLPVIFDMAECYPEMLKNLRRFAPFRPTDLLVRNPVLAAALERYVVRRVDATLVMIEESRDRLLAMGVPRSRIHIVSNTPDPARFDTRPPPPGRPYTLTYIGLLGFSRGLDDALEGIAAYLRRGKFIRFVIAGTGKAERSLRARVAQLGIEGNVEFAGWVDNGRLPALVAESDLCIVPHRQCPHWAHTIPNKLFDYMAAARPVLVTEVRPMARIVLAKECGMTYREGDPDSLADALTRLEDEALRRHLGENGRRAVEEEYHWQRDRTVLRDAVERHAGRAGWPDIDEALRPRG